MQFAYKGVKGKLVSRSLRGGKALSVLLCAALLTSCAGGNSSETTTSDTPTGTRLPPTAFPMPPVTAFNNAQATTRGWRMLDGRRATLADYAGYVVVLDFYATWCGPCRAEAPHLVALQRRYGSEGLHIVGLNVGGADDRFQIPQFVEQYGIQYRLGFPDPEMADLFLSDDTTIPQSFVFDRRGRLIKRFIGFSASKPAELERIVQTALAAGDDQ
ncbi:MAG: TlpA family protein disulfide reductase [Pyrinomonadaceae bacterium]|nr:TlpA family protein disulfide reductase [Pyrinomonadaceae bacterium]